MARELAAARGRPPLARDVVEQARKVRSDKRHGHYDSDSDQCGDEPIFDRGNAALGIERTRRLGTRL